MRQLLAIGLVCASALAPALAIAEPPDRDERNKREEPRSEVTSAPSLPAALSHSQPNEKQLARAKRLFELGLAAYDKGDLDAAAKFLLKAHAITPSPELAYNLGRIYERMGDAGRAIPLLRGYLQSARVSKDEAADIERRIAALEARSSQALSPLSPRAPAEGALSGQARSLFEHGMTAFKNGDYEGARSAFASAHDLTPLPELAYDLAVACERLGRTRDAADHFAAYLALRGKQGDAEEAKAVAERIRMLRVAANKPPRSSPPSAAAR